MQFFRLTFTFVIFLSLTDSVEPAKILRIAKSLAFIATHSCIPGGAGQSSSNRSDSSQRSRRSIQGQQGTTTTAPNPIPVERMIFQTLSSHVWELTSFLDTIVNRGVVYNAMSDEFISDERKFMQRILQFRSEWDGSSAHLTAQQVLRVKALAIVSGFIYNMQRQNFSDSHTFGSDATHLASIVEQLKAMVCNLYDTLPGVDAGALLKTSQIPNSFYVNVTFYHRKLLLMGLTLQDMRHFVNDQLRVSVDDATLDIITTN